MIGTPVVLSSAYTFAATAAGATGTPAEPAMLRTPSGQAMLVDDIQLWVKGQMLTAPAWHEWAINLGRAQLTDGYMPAKLCCRYEDVYKTRASNLLSRQAYLWSFARPIYMPRGQVLQIKVRSGVAAGAATVSIRGRVLRDGDMPVPRRVAVPYASSFRPGVMTDAAAADPNTYGYKSAVSDLGNPFTSPLNVQRFVMGSTGNETAVAEVDDFWGNAGNVSALMTAQLQIYHSNGGPIVRDLVKLGEFASFLRNEWPVNFQLQPREVVYATVDQTHTAGTSGTQAGQVGIGMIGWRDVPISEVM